jgi:hypothetical protein
MQPANKAFLDRNRFYIESYSMESPPKKMNYKDRKELLRIVREEFEPEYDADLWCDPCIKSLILNAYIFYDEARK